MWLASNSLKDYERPSSTSTLDIWWSRHEWLWPDVLMPLGNIDVREWDSLSATRRDLAMSVCYWSGGGKPNWLELWRGRRLSAVWTSWLRPTAMTCLSGYWHNVCMGCFLDCWGLEGAHYHCHMYVPRGVAETDNDIYNRLLSFVHMIIHPCVQYMLLNCTRSVYPGLCTRLYGLDRDK